MSTYLTEMDRTVANLCHISLEKRSKRSITRWRHTYFDHFYSHLPLSHFLVFWLLCWRHKSNVTLYSEGRDVIYDLGSRLKIFWFSFSHIPNYPSQICHPQKLSCSNVRYLLTNDKIKPYCSVQDNAPTSWRHLSKDLGKNWAKNDNGRK